MNEMIDKKVDTLKSLFYLACCAHDDVSRVEAMFIIKVAEYLKVDLKELANFDGDDPRLERSNKRFRLMFVFHRLVLIILLNTDNLEKEQQYCVDLGINMGIHPHVVDGIIDYVLVGKDSREPDFLKLFSSFMN